MDVIIGDQIYEFDAEKFLSEIIRARLTLKGAEIVVSISVDEAHPRPDAIVVCFGNVVVTKQKLGRTDASLEVTCEIGVDLLPAPLNCGFTVYTLDEKRRTCSQAVGSAEATPLMQVVISNEIDFARLIQGPATRIGDEATILYGAVHALGRFPNDYGVRAGCLCVIGYRLIHRFPCEPEVLALFDAEAAKLLASPTRLPQGPSMRWIISVRLIVAYVEIWRGDTVAAEQQLREITYWGGQMAAWPSSLTNILLAQYGLGYLALQRGDSTVASDMFGAAESLFRYGSAVAEFRNVYSYGELGNALTVARECAIGQRIARSGKDVIHDPSIATPGTRLVPKILPAPLGWLLQPT
jgi:hypothetical protein